VKKPCFAHSPSLCDRLDITPVTFQQKKLSTDSLTHLVVTRIVECPPRRINEGRCRESLPAFTLRACGDATHPEVGRISE